MNSEAGESLAVSYGVGDGVIGVWRMEMDGDAKNALSEYHFRKQES